MDKAGPHDRLGRWREIVSDPLNLLIARHPLAGMQDGDLVVLHNGNRVPIRGPGAYYGDLSEILVVNRGVHEPLEEYVFQELMHRLPPTPTMLELGAYWGHYSLWLKTVHPGGRVVLVEPEDVNLQAGKDNFARHGVEGTFIQDFVAEGRFEVDPFVDQMPGQHLNILHSDIQGYEVEMLGRAAISLQTGRVDYVFISTHSQELHYAVVERLQALGIRVEVSSDFNNETTSYDGFVFGSRQGLPPLFPGINPLGRLQITGSSSMELLGSVLDTTSQNPRLAAALASAGWRRSGATTPRVHLAATGD